MMDMRTELLAPVGSPASLRAAVEAGADAVYLGAMWNARMRARNFTMDELARAFVYCRKNGVRAYVTVNTLMFENEIAQVADYIKQVYEFGANALLVQDLGVAAIAREVAPEIELHASTQLSTHNSKTAGILKKMGFKRAVLARELSIEQAKKIRENSGIDVEVFAHGALCYSYSGKCLFSQIQTGRSGNRGVCAQLCRMPWKLYCDGKEIKKGYLTSTKDLCTVNRAQEIQEAGICSIKLEGRLKGAEYVGAMVRAYRKALDNGEPADLGKLTSRGYTEGYLFGAANTEKLVNPKASAFRGKLVGKVEKTGPNGATVKLFSTIAKGDSLRTSRSGRTVELFRIYQKGKEVERASGECTLMIKTLKAGDELLKVERASIEDDFLSGVKAARVISGRLFSYHKPRFGFNIPRLFYADSKKEIANAPKGSCCVLPWEEADELALQEAKTAGVKIAVETPRVAFDRELPEVERKMKALSEYSPYAFLASELSLVSDYSTIVSAYANVCNTLAAKEWMKLGKVSGIVAAMEVPKINAESLGFSTYSGKNVELVISENDLFSELELPKGECFLVDPRGNRLRILRRNNRTVIMGKMPEMRLETPPKQEMKGARIRTATQSRWQKKPHSR